MSLRLEIKVVPSSGKMQCILDKNDKLKCYLKAPAEKGKANKELVQFLSKRLGVTQLQISIVAGRQSRNKIVAVESDISLQKALTDLGIVSQQKLF